MGWRRSAGPPGPVIKGRGQPGRSPRHRRLPDHLKSAPSPSSKTKRERHRQGHQGAGYEPSIVARALVEAREMDSVVVFAGQILPPSPRPKRTMGWRPAARKTSVPAQYCFFGTSPTWTSVKARVRMGLVDQAGGRDRLRVRPGPHRRHWKCTFPKDMPNGPWCGGSFGHGE